MKRLSDLYKDVNQLPKTFGNGTAQKSQTIRLSTNPTIKKRTQYLFAALSAIFTYKFNAQYPDQQALAIAKAVWQEALADLSDEQIKKGISFCMKNVFEFVPTMAEFRKICVTETNKEKYFQAGTADNQITEEEFKRRRMKGCEELEKIYQQFSWLNKNEVS